MDSFKNICLFVKWQKITKIKMSHSVGFVLMRNFEDLGLILAFWGIFWSIFILKSPEHPKIAKKSY